MPECTFFSFPYELQLGRMLSSNVLKGDYDVKNVI